MGRLRQLPPVEVARPEHRGILGSASSPAIRAPSRKDPQSVISDKSYAQKMLNKAALSRKERFDVFFAAGGAYKSDSIEKVLRYRCASG